MNGKLSTAAVIIISAFTAVIDLILFGGVHYNILLGITAALSCLPYLTSHGNRRAVSYELRIIILMTVISFLDIYFCSSLSFFRPLTAVTIAAGIFFGAPAGYTCGVFSALAVSVLSVTGGYTVIQVCIMGMVGFFAGIFSRRSCESNVFLVVLTLVSSAAYSCADVVSPIWSMDNGFDFQSYPSILWHSAKWFAVYAVSDILIVLILKKLSGRKVARMKKRFKIFEYSPKN